MKALKSLIAVAALATVSTSAFAADDSPAAQRVQQSLSQPLNADTAQQDVSVQATFADSGMSVAAGRIQDSISADLIHGNDRGIAMKTQDTQNDAGNSVAGNRVLNALSDSSV